MKRLSPNILATLPREVILPQYDREQLQVGIVHLGIGAFHRAHQAFYIESLLNQEQSNSTLSWGIVGCSLRSPTVREQMQAQGCLYTLVENRNDGPRYQIVSCIKNVLAAADQREELVQALTNPDIKIVSLTITEKGYCHDPASGSLNLNHPDIQHDLLQIDKAKSALGFLVLAMGRRRDKNLPGFTLMSCDNLPSNGKVLERVIKEFAQAIDPTLLPWIAEQLTFPSTMIDRIVPATTEEDKKQLASLLGVRDEALVKTEPFSQWVVEDNFARGRPAWEKVGVTMVDNVDAFEIMKLRLLNGAHSLIAYTGYLSGYETVADVMGDSSFRAMVKRFMDEEASPGVSMPAGFDLDEYKNQLIERFSNTALQHRTWQIAMDGSQKIPQRWLETLRYQLANNGPIDILVLGLAAWIQYVTGTDDEGNAIEVSDPWAETLFALGQKYKGGNNKNNFLKDIFSIEEIFSKDLVSNQGLLEQVGETLKAFSRQGVRTTVKNTF